ncbi:MAG: hypothetical protein E6Q96_01170 [Cyclobacteriaceae bacterium]|nr:hypothetical protein [Chitinophagales bacterium]TXH30867.1 MAG: hypothetical protein E6Q96_01170 [Cyclobacteriaceae bacterium]
METKENKSAKQSSGNSMIRNIAVGVITPVLAAAIIYFLGFNKGDDKAEFRKKKEATEKVWTSYIQNKEIFSTVMKKLGGSEDIEAVRSSINHEIETTISNLDNVKKEPNADQRVYSSIDITIQQMKDMKPLMNKFLDDMTAFVATNPTEEQGMAYIQQLSIDLQKKMGQLSQRDSMRLATYYDGMNKDYSITLPRTAGIRKDEE